MELIRDLGKALYHIQQYRDGVIIVNQKPYAHPIIVLVDDLITPWPVESSNQLSAAHFDCLLPFAPQIVLLGTGQKSQFPSMRIFDTLIMNGIACEIMNTKAACGAYTLLMSEGKKVAAALIN
jgi:uncharacterized protein